jgi:hypothetical protein
LVAEHLTADHGHGLALRRVDLAGHDRRARLVFGQDKFAEAGTGPRAEQADIVCDLEQAGRHRIDGAVREHVGIVGSQRLELVGGAGERQFRDSGSVFRKQPGEFWLRIEPSADRGATLRQRVQISYRRSQPGDPALDLGCVAGKFLTQR